MWRRNQRNAKRKQKSSLGGGSGHAGDGTLVAYARVAVLGWHAEKKLTSSCMLQAAVTELVNGRQAG